MNIHEYQGKQLFSRFGVNVLENRVAKTGEEAAKAFDELGGSVAVVKAQIHAGGRGKGTFIENADQHGVQLVKSADEAKTAAANMIGNLLVTIQTGPEGKQVNQVIVEAGCDMRSKRWLTKLPRKSSRRFSILHKESKATKFVDSARSLASLGNQFSLRTSSSKNSVACMWTPTAAC